MQRICVIGFGLNGILASIASKNAGFEVDIFEEGNLEGYKSDTRTSVLTFETIEFFRILGLYDSVKTILAPIYHIYSFEELCKPVLAFDCKDEDRPFGYVVHNFALKEILLKKVKDLGINIINNKILDFEVDQNFVNIIMDGEGEFDLKYKLVLNCKGKAEGEKIGKSLTYNQRAFVFNLKHSLAHKNIAVEGFTPSFILALLPLLNQNESAVIWSVRDSIANFLSGLTKEEFLNKFKEQTGRMGHVGEIESITSDIKSYPLSLSFTKVQSSNRTMLIGDVFNSIHPVAGQAFNMSLKDVVNLYNGLIEAKELGLDVGSLTFLQQIAKKNIRHHLEMNLFTHLLVKVFSSSNGFLKILRNLGIYGIENISPLKNFLTKKASGVKG